MCLGQIEVVEIYLKANDLCRYGILDRYLKANDLCRVWNFR